MTNLPEEAECVSKTYFSHNSVYKIQPDSKVNIHAYVRTYANGMFAEGMGHMSTSLLCRLGNTAGDPDRLLWWSPLSLPLNMDGLSASSADANRRLWPGFLYTDHCSTGTSGWLNKIIFENSILKLCKTVLFSTGWTGLNQFEIMLNQILLYFCAKSRCNCFITYIVVNTIRG